MTMAMKMTMAKTTFAMAIGKEEDLAAAINLSYTTWQQQDSLLPLSQYRPASSPPNLSSPSCPGESPLQDRHHQRRLQWHWELPHPAGHSPPPQGLSDQPMWLPGQRDGRGRCS